MNRLRSFSYFPHSSIQLQLRTAWSGQPWNVHRLLSTNPFPLTPPEEIHQDKVSIGDLQIRYKVIGSGPQTLLCLPGIIGSIETDFGPILTPLTNGNQFTVVSWDPPGYGYSRPPERDFAGDFYQRDASVVMKLMDKLGFGEYAVLGWSSGGVTGAFVASDSGHKVSKLVTWGAHAYADDRAVLFSKMMGNLDNWSDKMKGPMLKLYGERYLQKMLTEWGNSVENYQKRRLDKEYKEAMTRITCPALIIHGEHDQVLGIDHAEFLHQQIPNSTLKIFPEGKHNLHLRYTKEFLQLVIPFLLKQENTI